MLSRSPLLTACALAATTASATAFQSTTFGPQQVITTNANLCSSVDAADLDGDGDADVISSSAGDDKVAWYRNKNAGGFGTQKVISNGIGDTLFVHAADLDGDGDMDIISGAPLSSARVVWFENTGTTTFSGEKQIFGGAFSIADAHAADMDGDGDNDVLMAFNLLDQIGWIANDGNGNFSGVTAISTTADGVRDINIADLDGDGDPDVLACNYVDDEVVWYQNDGSGGFSNKKILAGGNLARGPRNAQAGDMDGDGDLDVVSTSVEDRKVAWYENLGGGSFGAQQVIATDDSEARGLELADLDNDGDLDILTTSEIQNNVDWYENLGGGSFGPQHVITTLAAGANFVLAADLDGDGDADVLSGSPDDNKVAWYENLLSDSPCTVTYCNDPTDGNEGDLAIDTCVVNGGPGNTLTLSDSPNALFGYPMIAAAQGALSNPPGATGTLCVGPSGIGRYSGDLKSTGGSGGYAVDIYNSNTTGGGGGIPGSAGGGVLTAGDTWNFQCWNRIGGGSTFSAALTVTFK